MKKTGDFATTIGNHEFTYGLDILKERMAQTAQKPDSMTIISANIAQKDHTLLASPYARTQVAGVEVCVLA